ncbi:hypothetical protein J2799_004642 [Chryseobacterium vietnamense]|nr:hypothetical protein [Chryseobacterium vietnamense]
MTQIDTDHVEYFIIAYVNLFSFVPTYYLLLITYYLLLITYYLLLITYIPPPSLALIVMVTPQHGLAGG